MAWPTATPPQRKGWATYMLRYSMDTIGGFFGLILTDASWKVLKRLEVRIWIVRILRRQKSESVTVLSAV